MTKLIGIVGNNFSHSPNDTFGVPNTYMDYFNKWGTPVVLSPFDENGLRKMLSIIDLIVLPGGPDIYSYKYKEIPGFIIYNPSAHLQYFDDALLPIIVREEIPTVGICRGLQALNVFFGGTLHQNLRGHKQSYTRDERVHEVFLLENDRTFKVNSLHHQGIKTLGTGLIPLVQTKEGLIESFKHKDLKIFGVQWHPEELDSDFFTEEYINEFL